MNFRLSEEQQQLQDAVRRIVSAPGYHERLRSVVGGQTPWDEVSWRHLVDFGAPGIVAPEQFGGAGLTMVELALVAEVLGYAGEATPFLGHALATIAIAEGGSERQRDRWLPLLASGEKIASVALSDRNDTWAPGDWTLALDGSRISGRKINAPAAQIADVLVVGLAGGQLAVVEVQSPAVTMEPMDGVDVTRPLVAVEFSDADADVLENGPAGAARMHDAALVLLAADAFGGASRILDMTRDYSLVREAFGAKLAQFQAYKHQLANLAVEVIPTRGLYWYAAYAFDSYVERSSHAAALAKAHSAELFLQTARLGTELHGGIGFTWEYDSQIWLKRAMFDFAWGGRPDRLFARAADLAGW